MQRDDATIATYKTQAWQTPQVFGVYQAGIYSDHFGVALKNLREIAMAIEYARGRVLDAGAGTGRFTIPLHDAGFDVTGLDVSEEMLAIARQAAGDRPIPFLQGSIFDLPYEPRTFDTIVSITVINHFPQWAEILREYVRVLRPGGRLVFNMRSQPHVAFANRNGVRFGLPSHPNDPTQYMAEIETRDVVEALAALGATVTHLVPYESFNSNFILQEALGASYQPVVDRLQPVFREPGALQLWEYVERHLFPHLPITVGYGFMVMAELPGAEAPLDAWVPPPPLPSAERLDAEAIAALLGPAYDAFCAGLEAHLEPAGALQLVLELDDLIGRHLPLRIDFLSLLAPATRARLLDQVAWRWTRRLGAAATAGGFLGRDGLPYAPLMEYVVFQRFIQQLKPLV